MAFGNGTIWHIKSTGSTSNGGGFDPTNANFATDGTVDTNTGNTASPVFSSASYNFTANDVGAWLFIQSGTDSIPGWYQIASVASNKATLTASIGSAVLYGTDANKKTYHRPAGLNTAAGIATVGTPTGLVWGVDYSQATSARIAFTDMVIDGTTNTIFTSAANPVGKNFVGNIINVTSGTGFTVQRVQVVSTSGTQATCDKSLGTLSSTGGNGNLGGAVGSSATLDAITYALVAGNKVYIWATGTYTLTATTTVTASVKGDTTNGLISIEGCSSYMGDHSHPTITSATNSCDLITINDNDYFEFRNLTFTHSAGTRGRAFNCTSGVSNPVWMLDIIVDGCLNGIGSSTIGIIGSFTIEDSEIKNCTSHGIQMGNGSTINLYRSEIHDCGGSGIITSTAGGSILNIQYSIIDNNTSNGITTQHTTSACRLSCHASVIALNDADGVDFVSTSSTHILDVVNTIFYGNGAEGFDNNDGLLETFTAQIVMRNNAFGGNTSANYTNLYPGDGDQTLTADPFTDSGSRDFTLNNTAGGGALCRLNGVGGFDIGRWQSASGTSRSYVIGS